MKEISYCTRSKGSSLLLRVDGGGQSSTVQLSTLLNHRGLVVVHISVLNVRRLVKESEVCVKEGSELVSRQPSSDGCHAVTVSESQTGPLS